MIHVSNSTPGNIHDKKLLDDSGVKLPDNAKGDLGYLGAGIVIPRKSSKLHSLTKTQTLLNARHSRKRIIVEHVFALIKSYRILADRFRGHLSNYNQYFLIVCGLCNFARA
ncbi:transposase [Patescibacteria group bacterium]|nr:transposase [Patescibacteria group bacterium]